MMNKQSKGLSTHAEHTNKHNSTVLHWAARDGNFGVVKMLLEVADELNLNRANDEGKTPLMLAEENKHIQTARLLRIAEEKKLLEDLESYEIIISPTKGI